MSRPYSIEGWSISMLVRQRLFCHCVALALLRPARLWMYWAGHRLSCPAFGAAAGGLSFGHRQLDAATAKALLDMGRGSYQGLSTWTHDIYWVKSNTAALASSL